MAEAVTRLSEKEKAVRWLTASKLQKAGTKEQRQEKYAWNFKFCADWLQTLSQKSKGNISVKNEDGSVEKFQKCTARCSRMYRLAFVHKSQVIAV
jgi:hypothetical protein